MENINQAVIVNVKLEKEDVGEYSAIILKSKIRLSKRQEYLLIITVIIFTLLVLYTLFTSNNTNDLTSAAGSTPKQKLSIWPILLLSLAVIYRIASPIVAKVIAMRQFDKNKQIQNEIEYSFTSYGILAQSETKTANWRWVEVVKIIETKQYYAIIEANQSANIIPKRCFASDEDRQAVEGLMKDNMKDKKYEVIQGL